MNCKQGDLALVVRGPKKNLGKLVTCIEMVKSPGEGWTDFKIPVWRVDQKMTWHNDRGKVIFEPYAPDAALMPIRGMPEDERIDEEALT
jgi:hypothetical protein